MKKKIIIWLIKVFIKGYHLHRDPVKKVASPVEQMEGQQ